MNHRKRQGFVRTVMALVASLALQACSLSPAQLSATDPFGSTWDDMVPFDDGLLDSRDTAGPAGATIYHIDLVVSPELNVVEGRQWIRYTNREAGELDDVYFRLFANVTGSRTSVSALSAAGTAVQPILEAADSALRVPLPEPLQPGESINLQMDFRVELNQETDRAYGVLGHFDDYLLLDGFYPVVPVFDDEGWSTEDLVPIGDATYLDASFYLVRIAVPRDLVLVASGSEIGRDRSGANQVVTFAAGPARDFFLAGHPDFEVVGDQGGGTVVRSYGRPADRPGTELALQFASDSLALFTDRLGSYPYAEFDVIGAPIRSLGIEYPGTTAISVAMYDLGSVVADLPAPIMLEGTVVHEVAHQWFYNVVGNDQLDEPWLDEALAQYLTGWYYRETYGDQAEQEYRESWTARWDRIDREPIPIGRPTRAYTAETYSPIVYGRGPLFLAVLEELMGRDGFADFLRDYYETNRWSIATGASFRALAEQHCRCDLGPVFADWVGGT